MLQSWTQMVEWKHAVRFLTAVVECFQSWLPASPPILVLACCSSHQDTGLLLLHLDLGWPCDLLWQGECGRSIVVPVLCHHKITLWWWLSDIVLKMHGNFSFNSVGSQSACIEAWAKLGGERETALNGPDWWVRPVSVLIKLPVPVTSWVNPAESSQNTNERNNKELLF